MAISDIPLLSMLRTRMQWSQARQQVLAENVANADSPGFKPRDLVPPDFGANGPSASSAPPSVTLARTEPGHIAGLDDSSSLFRDKKDNGYEIRPTGNSVSLEDEMMKLASNQMNYQAVTALYVNSLNLLKTAIGKA
jgi:flagellar basal-body rod protein FlgB